MKKNIFVERNKTRFNGYSIIKMILITLFSVCLFCIYGIYSYTGIFSFNDKAVLESDKNTVKEMDVYIDSLINKNITKDEQTPLPKVIDNKNIKIIHKPVKPEQKMIRYEDWIDETPEEPVIQKDEPLVEDLKDTEKEEVR